MSPLRRLTVTLPFACALSLLGGGLAAPLAAAAAAPSAAADLSSWPAGDAPAQIGQRLARRFLASPHGNDGKPSRIIIYPETCAWYGALTFAQVTHDQALTAALIARFQPLFGPEAHLVPKPVNVDATVFAAVPFQLAIETHEDRYLKLGRRLADAQWRVPADFPQELARMSPADREVHEAAAKAGLSWQTRLWVDDMYMITMAQVQAYRATGDSKYLDRAAREVVYYLDRLQQPNGLFYHAPDVPFFWGRGNGWFSAGMTETLRSLPADHPLRPRILAGYRKMMAGLLKYQDANGTWHQLVDDPDAWPESSCTGMFAYGLISGVRNGWLDAATYGPAARKAWLGLISFIQPDGAVRDVCEGTNKKDSRQYYLDRKRITGDLHGQAPVLWTATALLRPAL
jgi:unsaturated rhamnogalacturonyl hydrolase